MDSLPLYFGAFVGAAAVTATMVAISKKIPKLKAKPFISGWIIAVALMTIVGGFGFAQKGQAPAFVAAFMLYFLPSSVSALLLFIRNAKQPLDDTVTPRPLPFSSKAE